jgi:hypothetical protein
MATPDLKPLPASLAGFRSTGHSLLRSLRLQLPTDSMAGKTSAAPTLHATGRTSQYQYVGRD